MKASIDATKLAPAGAIRWRIVPLTLTPRTDAGYSLDDCLARVNDPKASPVQKLYSGAVCAAFHQRAEQPFELSCLEIGKVSIVHLPGEPMILFQLYAQRLKPESFVAVAGYGDCACGYICSEKAFSDNAGYEQTASNSTPDSESLLKKTIAALLGVEENVEFDP